jgi:RNA methyltransferase, TrmH family
LKYISSSQNSLIKSLIQLQEKAKIRKQTQTFLIEGLRELDLAHQGGYEIETILWFSERIQMETFEHLIQNNTNCVEVSREVYEKLAYRDSTEGIIGVAKSKKHDLSSLKLSENPLILVVESIEKPGNLGAMLRTADAARVDAVLIANPKGDLYNPNIIRSSVGCVFTNQIGIATSEEIIEFLKLKSIAIYSATLQNSNSYDEEDYQHPTAIVLGTEATGLSEIWRNQSTQNIIIPMHGTIDSMNVSVAAAILIYEAKRQRKFNKI